MLDLTKLAGELPGISQHLKQEANASRVRLERAQELLSLARGRQEELVELQKKWRDRAIFANATPIEPLNTRIEITPTPTQHTVFATDGSQISPSHHEIAYCYLINIGRVMLHYGQSLHPLLDNLPEIYYKPEDLYISKQWGIRTDEWMGHCRTVSEAKALAEMACQWVKPPGAHYLTPNLAMVDGSLIYWFLEGMPTEARDRLLLPILDAWEELRQTKIPLIGYLSVARSSEATNFLRLQACRYDTPDCLTHCANLDRLPCQIVDPLRDTTLWGNLLQPGQRGTLWRSSAKILDLYPESLRTHFCYVHVGEEIARIEVPQWVIEDADLFNQSLSIVLGQVYKGYGYPVALAESHNQAVVRSRDRAHFFALLEQQMIRAGLRNVGTSYKEARKRSSIA
ncbi:DNA double-strand break repair nuclease NurA [Lusitaniella coriacea]|uniref:DNA double-strand break repair nuclease NurA n=1 Tax=Lusitaniella coriacea TaxID=1983105 RepID=UPI003CEF6750